MTTQSRTRLIWLAVILGAFVAFRVLSTPSAAPSGSAFSDDFNRESLGENWKATGPEAVSISEGSVFIRDGHNRPLWLKTPIPQNATIEFDAWSETSVGDIKVEAWGDGHSFYAGDLRLQYTATGYVFILGGWNNTASTIARGNEHRPGQPMRHDFKVAPYQKYHWKIQRQGARLSWFIDGVLFLQYDDPVPLSGDGNSYFAFSDWASPVHFDNLVITAGSN